MAVTRTGLRLINALRKARSRSALNEVPETFFDEGEEREGFRWLRDHVQSYNAWPSTDVFRSNTGLDVILTPEPLAYYVNEARQRALWQMLLEPFKDIRKKIEARDADAALDIMKRVISASSELNHRREGLITLSEAFQLVQEDYDIAKRVIGIRGIPTGYDFLDEQTDGWQNGDLISVVARTGRGKAQPVTEPVLMSDGTWKRMGDLQVGDELASVDGSASVVTEIHPQGVRPVFEVEFADGRKTRCDVNHLWQVDNLKWRTRHRVLTTRQLMVAMQSPTNRTYMRIPLCNGEFGAQRSGYPIDPWLLGFLLGDGCFRGSSLTFSTDDEEILHKVQSKLPAGMHVQYLSGYDYAIRGGLLSRNPLIETLKGFGLWGKLSTDKHVPEIYFSASRRERVELLRGVMDADGHATHDGRCQFLVSSERLAQDVQRLIRSIGGLASISVKPTSHHAAYRVNIRVRNPSELFSLTRKSRMMQDSTQYSETLGLKIRSIKRVEDEECQCISVSHPSKLYVTNDYVVTHNTYKLLKFASTAHAAGYSVLFLSMEMVVLSLARRYFGIMSGIDPNFLRRGNLSTRSEREMRRQLAQYSENEVPFWWLAGNFKKTVPALKAAIYECEPDLIIADASYLLTPEKTGKVSSRREAIADVIEQLGGITKEFDRPLIQSVQFNRQANKPKRDEDDEARHNPVAHLTLEKIGETDTIGQSSAIVLGLEKGDPPHEDDERYCGIMKGREGEQGWYKYHYKFRPVNFDYITDHTRVRRNDNDNTPPPDLSYMEAEA